MKNRLLVFAFLIVALPATAPVAALAQTTDTRGREFFISFLPNYGSGAETETSDMRIYLSSSVVTVATVTDNSTGASRRVELPVPLEVVEVDLDEIFGNGIELQTGTPDTLTRKSIMVQADDEITLSGVSVRGKSADAFVAYPTDVLRGRNWVMAYGNGFATPGEYDMPSEFAIIAIEDETAVEIIPSTKLNGRPAHEPYMITLSRGEVYFAQAELGGDNDVTGTEINATLPVAVFGGNRRTSIPRSLGNFRDHLVEQIPPTDAWGTDVIVAPFFTVEPLSTDIAVVRILSGDYENSWSIDGVFQGTLERGIFVDVPLTRAMRITAAASILVAQYDHSSGTDQTGSQSRLGDPCMMIVPAVDNYDTVYAFQSIPHPEFTRHFITVVAPSVSIASLRLDGATVNTASFRLIQGTTYSYAQIELPSGAHLIRGDSAFGVQVYGYGVATSYAYTGGFVFRRLITGVEIENAPAAGPLSGIFPNPVAGISARILLRLDHGSPVTIDILDSRGDIVLRPLSGIYHDAGTHDIIIDIASLPSGSYHVRTVAGDRSDQRPLLITR